MTAEQAIAHLVGLAEGWDCGAKMEDAIVAAHQPELDAFASRSADPNAPHDIRLIRAVLAARDNRDGYRKDAAALRLVLTALAECNGKLQTPVE